MPISARTDRHRSGRTGSGVCLLPAYIWLQWRVELSDKGLVSREIVVTIFCSVMYWRWATHPLHHAPELASLASRVVKEPCDQTPALTLPILVRPVKVVRLQQQSLADIVMWGVTIPDIMSMTEAQEAWLTSTRLGGDTHPSHLPSYSALHHQHPTCSQW